MVLYVSEIFTSIQGEGIHTGLPTIFIRLSGCNLRCTWCDTPYALEMESGEQITVEDIIKKISGKGIDLVCISGGEPLFQEELLDLIKGLVDIGMRMDVETNGSYDIKELVELGSDVMVSMDSKTPSSGETDSLIISNLSYLRSFDQLKFVVSDERDISYAVDLIKEHSPRCNIIFTPVDNQNGGDMASFLMDLVMSGDLPTTVRLMVQTHKVLWNAEKRGV